MMVDTRPNACVTFKKSFDKPLMSAAFINNDP